MFTELLIFRICYRRRLNDHIPKTKMGDTVKSILAATVVAAAAATALCSCFAAEAAPLPRAKPEEVGMSSERLALIGKAVNAEIARGQLPGAVLAIARRGK